jgi:cell division protease FtsH
LIFLGREISEQRDYSEAVAEQIDREVRKLVNEAYERARLILREHRDALDRVAAKLLEEETISRDEFEKLYPSPVKQRRSTPVVALSN